MGANCNRWIGIEKLSQMLNFQLADIPKDVKTQFNRINTTYRTPTKKEAETYIFETLKEMNMPEKRRSRQENLLAWERGWGENYEAFKNKGSEKSLKPKYFRPSKYFRFDKQIIMPENPQIEYDLLRIVRHIFFIQYFSGFDNVYELGCGSCQNLIALGDIFPDKQIFGLDWTNASVKISQLINARHNKNVKGILFDMLDPDEAFDFRPNSIVFTFHAMEQVGENHQKLLSFLIKKKPSLVFHFEPLVELFDPDNLYDYLATMYCRKRDYLKGYLDSLNKRAISNEIEILNIHRPMIGGIRLDASVVTWKCN